MKADVATLLNISARSKNISPITMSVNMVAALIADGAMPVIITKNHSANMRIQPLMMRCFLELFKKKRQ